MNKEAGLRVVSAYNRILEASILSDILNKIRVTLSKVPQVQETLGMIKGLDPKKALEKLKKSLGSVDKETFDDAQKLLKLGPQAIKTAGIIDLKRTVMMAVLIMLVAGISGKAYSQVNFQDVKEKTEHTVQDTGKIQDVERYNLSKQFFAQIMDEHSNRVMPIGDDALLKAFKNGEFKTKDEYFKWDVKRIAPKYSEFIKIIKEDFEKQGKEIYKSEYKNSLMDKYGNDFNLPGISIVNKLVYAVGLGIL